MKWERDFPPDPTVSYRCSVFKLESGNSPANQVSSRLSGRLTILTMTVNAYKPTTFFLVVVVVLFVYNITSNSFFVTQSPVTNVGHGDQSQPSVVRLWFFALDCDKPHLEFYAKQAVLSAIHYTSLVPILMLHCRNSELEGWMQSHGVTVVDPHNSKLVQYLDANPDKLTNLGSSTWYRIAIPTVIDELIASKHPQIVQLQKEDPLLLQYALYTDADVVFLNKFHVHAHMLPRYFALPVQGDAWCCSDNRYSKKVHTNAGVILMNVTSFREIEPEFTDYVLKNIVKNRPGAQSFNDQTAFHSFFPIRLHNLNVFQIVHMGLFYSTYFKSLFTKYYSDTLPKFYEWEPYLGVNPEALIVHWHGLKVFINSCAQLQQHALPTHNSPSHTSTSNTSSDHYHQDHATNTTIDNVTDRISNNLLLVPPMVTTGVNKSMFSDPWQIVLQQLVLYNRTHPYSLHDHSFESHGRNRRLRTYHGESFDANFMHFGSAKSTYNKHTVLNNASYYPAMYDWYSPMALNEADTHSIQQLAKQSMFYLQTLTPHSLDGYHHATNLFFAYMHIICTSSS